MARCRWAGALDEQARITDGRNARTPTQPIQTDPLPAAVRYSSGAGRRKIAELVAEAAASAAAKPRPLRWCLWCGETLAPSVAGEFCDDDCRAEDAAAAAQSPAPFGRCGS